MIELSKIHQKDDVMKKERDSGIELLRIFAMFLVIGVHALNYGDFFDMARDAGGSSGSSALLIKIAARSAVNIFVVISGYFMIHSAFNLKKSYRRAWDTYIKIFFYSVVLSVIFIALGSEYCIYGKSVMPVGKIILRGLFPISCQQWYFLTDYFLLCLLAPFLNLGVEKLTQNHYAVLLFVLTFIFSIWMTLYYIEPFRYWFIIYGYNDIPGGKNVFSFVYLYLVGGFIGKFQKKREKPNFLYLLFAAMSVVLNYFLYTRLDKSVGYRDTAMNYTNPLVILFAVFLLLFFKDLHFKSKIINLFASTTIGVYAVHEFPFVRNIVWDIFDFKKIGDSGMLLNTLRLVGVILAVFFCGAVVDLLRQQLFKLAGCLKSRIKKKKIAE